MNGVMRYAHAKVYKYYITDKHQNTVTFCCQTYEYAIHTCIIHSVTVCEYVSLYVILKSKALFQYLFPYNCCYPSERNIFIFFTRVWTLSVIYKMLIQAKVLQMGIVDDT